MKKPYIVRTLWIIAVLSLAPIACQKSYVLAPVSPLSLTPTPTSNVPVATATFTTTSNVSSPTPTSTGLIPTSTFTITPTLVSGTPTFTPTPTTFVPPTGLWVVGIFLESVDNIAFEGVTETATTTDCEVYISTNLTPDTTAAVTLITPLNGSVPVTYTANTTYSGVSVAEYVAAANSFTYVPNSPYSLYAVTSLGSAAATVNAPGDITIAADGSMASAVYPGNYDSAVVEEISPAAVTTYQSPTGTSVGSPFTYPTSAYPAPAGTGTYGVAYNAAVTDTSVTSAAVGSAWVGDEVDLITVTR